VVSESDSRSVLGNGGAEQLHHVDEALYVTREMTNPVHVSIADMPGSVLNQQIAKFKREYPDREGSDWEDEQEHPRPDPLFGSVDADENDDLYQQAETITREAGQASTSFLQRKTGIGYARAAKLMDMPEDHGVFGPVDGAKPRSVIEHRS
jgi:DNA segregation ATPase FtsK/SpoIIIE, S-DNA-T family